MSDEGLARLGDLTMFVFADFHIFYVVGSYEDICEG